MLKFKYRKANFKIDSVFAKFDKMVDSLQVSINQLLEHKEKNDKKVSDIKRENVGIEQRVKRTEAMIKNINENILSA